jgi:hypothetical protein
MHRFAFLRDKKFWKSLYLSQGVIMGTSVWTVNAYNNLQVLREYHKPRSLYQTHYLDPVYLERAAKEITYPVLLLPFLKGILYGLTSPLSYVKIALDRSNGSQSHHMSLDYRLFLETQYNLAKKNKLIGIKETDTNFDEIRDQVRDVLQDSVH